MRSGISLMRSAASTACIFWVRLFFGCPLGMWLEVWLVQDSTVRSRPQILLPVVADTEPATVFGGEFFSVLSIFEFHFGATVKLVLFARFVSGLRSESFYFHPADHLGFFPFFFSALRVTQIPG